MESLVSRLRESSRILVFTGAGISTGSGIPDFRGPKGVWKKRKPVYLQDFLESEEARIEHWDYKLEGYEAFRNAKPNAAHRAIVELEKREKLLILVTQNIDGLHQDAGQDPACVIEIHGTNRQIECVTCGARSEPDPAFQEFRQTRKPPLCSCGGFLKTATISFGQAMPEEELKRAFALAEQADLAISIGSTLEVQPAALVPLAAVRAGAPYVIINQGRTAHDDIADLRIEGDAVGVLSEALAAL